MAQRKLRPLPHILNLINELTDEQRADLLDYLRGKQPKKERKPNKKTEKAPKETTKAEGKCVTCGELEFDGTALSPKHDLAAPEFDHKFRASLKQKA